MVRLRAAMIAGLAWLAGLAGLAWLACAPASAAPAVLGTEALQLADPGGSTWDEALAEANARSRVCAKPGSGCDPSAPTPRQLLPASAGCTGPAPVLGWRLAGELPNARTRAAEWQRLAATRELFDCRDAACLAVVPTAAAGRADPGSATWSVCEMPVVHGVPGAPARCQEALKQPAQGDPLLRAKVGNQFVACSMGLRDFDALFRDRGADVAAVRRLVDEVLRATPFDLSVMDDGGALVGTRAQLASQVLKGWREWVTVRVDVAVRGADAAATITTTLLVSKQASANREAWTPPSEAQEAAYLLSLRHELERRGGTLTSGAPR